jgi:DNA polymerase III sliding clamp (beta) subunit (PCNA family)
VELIDSLKFIKGSFNRNELSSFTNIRKGRVTAFDGSLMLSAPINLDIDVSPDSQAFYKAISSCSDALSITITNSGRMSIKSGKFKSFVKCIEPRDFNVTPSGEHIDLSKVEFLSGVKKLIPFVGTDENHKWATGILFKGSKLYATNNVIACSYQCNTDNFGSTVVIPSNCLKELLRIGENPTHCLISDNAITFYYSNDRFLYSNLIVNKWPDIDSLLVKSGLNIGYVSISKEVKEAIKHLGKFSARGMYLVFEGSAIKLTNLEESENSASFSIENYNFPFMCFNYEMFLKVVESSDSIDYTNYPTVYFKSQELVGAIRGYLQCP